ncbi:hypothetical protein DYB37_012146 [Aphanomyces astaci]|uniref:Uncharacterized protein n=1 Tax=Aphanomyces astaci TaxID=112090 RepID=A0A397B0A9_APHAT|nr:hypothetical protein DYB36_008924 [Aphanomyces astaci]RHY11964.1 hypothetical protein DYB25_003039 [Aphanomyces astaci]RHY36249.1 hypothetical protein DYB38_007826 [Aphanomyces astaci]RHY49669.1 hypothetical protein DYB34_009306 [Aphanomyces astaci]RHY67614.1 hypothetical protein DYB30_009091 [Aphanomyces astaci]
MSYTELTVRFASLRRRRAEIQAKAASVMQLHVDETTNDRKGGLKRQAAPAEHTMKLPRFAHFSRISTTNSIELPAALAI